MKNIGDKAPEVLGINEKGEEIRLSAYKGKKIVLYFYPKDSTSGCTAQACSRRMAGYGRTLCSRTCTGYRSVQFRTGQIVGFMP